MIVRRAALFAVVCLLAAPVSAGAQEKAKSDSDPTKPILFSLRPEFFHAEGGVWRTQVVARYDQAVVRNRRWLGGKRGMLFRLELPVATADAPGVSQATGLGDGYVQLLLIPRLSGRFAMVVGSGLILPTATADLLGGGKWTLAPTLVPVWFVRGIGLAYLKIQDYVSVAGDAARPSVHFLLVTPTFIRTVGTRSWLLLDTETKTDWETDRTDVKSGVQLGHMRPGSIGLWLKPEVTWAGDRRGDWNLKTGLVWYR